MAGVNSDDDLRFEDELHTNKIYAISFILVSAFQEMSIGLSQNDYGVHSKGYRWMGAVTVG